jgi:hypothetical protein
VKTDHYVPRRADWTDPVGGMPPRYRDLVLTPSLKQAIQTKYAVGFWTEKPECTFPVVPEPPADQRPPWTQDGDPFGEIYYTTPGSYFFQSTCMKCHGPGADGQSSLAKGILNASGGQIRVANLIDGLFGGGGANLKTFDLDGKNYAGNYLIWMAMEGTRVKFPDDVSSIVGKHGARMLNIVRDGCIAQISGASTKYQEDYEIFNKICFMENLSPGDPVLAYDSLGNPVHPDKVEDWADHAAFNAGWAIFDFLSSAAAGHWEPRVNQCEVLYGPK